jgi:hypothetical protein
MRCNDRDVTFHSDFGFISLCQLPYANKSSDVLFGNDSLLVLSIVKLCYCECVSLGRCRVASVPQVILRYCNHCYLILIWGMTISSFIESYFTAPK